MGRGSARGGVGRIGGGNDKHERHKLCDEKRDDLPPSLQDTKKSFALNLDLTFGNCRYGAGGLRGDCFAPCNDGRGEMGRKGGSDRSDRHLE